MEIREREFEGVKVLDLEGKITSGGPDLELRRKLSDLLSAGHRRVVINLGGVPYIDSSGLGEVVRCHSSVKQHGGRLKFSAPSRRVVDLLNLTKLDTVLDVYDTDAAAAASFAAAR